MKYAVALLLAGCTSLHPEAPKASVETCRSAADAKLVSGALVQCKGLAFTECPDHDALVDQHLKDLQACK